MPTDPPSSQAVPLEYPISTSPWRRRIRLALLGLILVATILCTWHWGPYICHQTKLLYWQRQCMNFSLPPNTVVYEGEPTNAAQTAALAPQCWRSFCDTNNSHWVGGGRNTAVGFLGERISPAGHRRLICATLTPSRDVLPAFIMKIDCIAVAATPATWTDTARLSMLGVGGVQLPIQFAAQPPLIRIFAGQPDPKDASHFTIRFQIGGQEDVIDGWLRDSDSLTLRPRYLPQRLRN
jgi:hypothetical protein